MGKIFSIFAGAAIIFGSLVSAAHSQEANVKMINASSIIKKNAANSLSVYGLSSQTFTVEESKATSQLFSGVNTLAIADFPIDDKNVGTIVLRPHRPVADGTTKWFVQSKSGRREVPAPKAISYVGEVVGESNSKVFVTYAEGILVGSVERNNGKRYTIAPTQEVGSTLQHAVIPATQVSEMLARTATKVTDKCLTDENNMSQDVRAAYAMEQQSFKKSQNAASLLNQQTLYELKVQPTIGFSTFSRLGNSVTRSQAYLLALMAEVSWIYEREVGVTMTVIDPIIWTEKIFNNDGGMANLLLNEWSQFAANEYTNDRDLSHYFSIYSPSGGSGQYIAGIACGIGGVCEKRYLGCQGTPSGYAVTTTQSSNELLPFISYTDDVGTAAHEMGHNLGSAHTFNCQAWRPILDSCVTANTNPSYAAYYFGETCFTGAPIRRAGTLMSYCHLINGTVDMTFSTRVSTFLRNFILSKSCATEPASTLIKVTKPFGRVTYQSGLLDTIRWVSSKSNSVNISYSLDSGKTWTTIQDGVPAAPGFVTWTIPSVNANSVYLRVMDATNSVVGDTTIVPFKIAAPYVKILTPAGGQRYGFGEKVTVQWEYNLVNNVKLEYTTDGLNWNSAASTIAASTGSYDFTVPNVATEIAQFRLTSIENPALVFTSGYVAFGQQTLTVTNPVKGSQWVPGTSVPVQWESDFLNRVRIELSTDSGATYARRIIVTYDANLKSYTYSLPSSVALTKNARIRFTNLANTSQTFLSEFFEIVSVKSVEESILPENSLELIPNPARENVVFSISSQYLQSSNKSLKLMDVNGKELLNLTNQLNDNATPISISLANFASGSYYVVLELDGKRISKTLNVVK